MLSKQADRVEEEWSDSEMTAVFSLVVLDFPARNEVKLYNSEGDNLVNHLRGLSQSLFRNHAWI